MRQIFGNQMGNLSPLTVTAVDTPAHGEPQRRYEIQGFNTASNPANRGAMYPALFNALPIFIHAGPVFMDAPLNGVTVEALLSVVADHLRTKLGTAEASHEDYLSLESVMLALNLQTNRSEMVHRSMDMFAHRQSA